MSVRRLRRLVVLLLAVAGVLAWLPVPSRAGVANGGLPGAPRGNPLAGMRWGTWVPATLNASLDAPSAYFARADAGRRSLLGRILAEPRARWFGAWIPGGDVRMAVRRYVASVTRSDPAVGAQLVFFALQPFERAACRSLPTRAQRAAYLRWIHEAARGIGASRAVVTLQPDMPFTRCLPRHSRVDQQLVATATRILSALPHTTVYIDAGAADWLSPGEAADMLARSGVRHARGFALDLTHYDSTSRQVRYGQAILRLLARRGIRGRHFVVNTAQNGRPFTTQSDPSAFRRGPVCARPGDRRCVTLGHPPTTATSRRGADGYLWLGRPWLANTRVRTPDEVARLVRTSPWFSALQRRLAPR